MELKIISNKENKTIGRKEIAFSVISDSSVKREELKAELCKMLNLSPASTIVVRTDSGFGTRMCSGTAHSYADEEALKKYENRGLLERLKIVEKVVKKAATPAAKAEEKK